LKHAPGFCVDLPPAHNAAAAKDNERKYFLSVGVIIKDEASFVEEWARHYIAEVGCDGGFGGGLLSLVLCRGFDSRV
jgi:hypothetical protein